ncbi:DHA2 family efflux MFS transporter permease subunit [Streptomyces sp. NBC_00620]|uniref:DHA2 family efflux MFS transporter permease subunit n=1 Tax=Streptomyces sp. NBC_00620 TaxID=2903666 RepID=UPI00224E2452|nr:DHA2 family efflux MFS transporter permease subunit [Streptomyces sp. NBC_00620]MCX4975028.1 DHA2 family efflux MFS transporter permease subunit [Streptomyces sp. NBC_00620]
MSGNPVAVPAGDGPDGRRGPRIVVSQKVAVGVVYVAGLFLSTLDMTIVNVALPSIGRAFSVPSTAVDTVSISYLVSLAVFVPASGWLGDRFGGKRTLLTAVAVFTVGSALCGMATSIGELVAFRVLQGAGGGMLASVGMAMLLRAFAPGERVRASAILSIANGLAPTLGPVVGGLLVTEVSWRAIFYVNVPVGVFAVVFGVLYLRNEPARPTERFDLAGFLLAASGLGLLMYGVSEGPERGWTTAPIAACVALGVVLVAAMIVVELRKESPMMDVRLLSDRLFASGTAVMTVQSVAFLGTLFTVTLYLQDERGMTPLAAGLTIFAEAVGVVTGSQLASRLLYRRLLPRRHLMLGAAGTSTTIALMSLWHTDTGLWWVRLLLFAMGLSVGQVFVGTQSASFATVTSSSSGRASTLFNVGRRLGGATGVAVATTVLVSATGGGSGTGSAPDMSGYRAAFLTAAALNLLGLYAATRVSDADAASTIPAPRTGRRKHQLRRRGDPLTSPDPLTALQKSHNTQNSKNAEEPRT